MATGVPEHLSQLGAQFNRRLRVGVGARRILRQDRQGFPIGGDRLFVGEGRLGVVTRHLEVVHGTMALPGGGVATKRSVLVRPTAVASAFPS